MNYELDFTKFDSMEGEEKYTFVKKLVIVSEKNPESVYPHFDLILDLLNDNKDVFRWNAIKIIGNLAPADKDKKIDALLPTLIDMLNSGNIITSKNIIDALVKIGIAQKQITDKIVETLIKIDTYSYDSIEHENIITGRAITALTALFPNTSLKDEIKAMAVKHIKRGRPEALKRAEELLKKLEENKN